MYLDVSGRRVYYTMEGKGAPLLLVHGWGGTSKSLKSLSAFFSAENTVILIDLPGFGQSDLPEADWGTPEYAKVIVEVIQKLNLGKIIYFGHSFGASLGIYLTAHYPELFLRLILTGASFKRSAPKKSKIGSFLRKLPLPHALTSFIRKIGYRILYPQSDSLRFPSLETNFRLILSKDLSSEASMIKTPTLILWGEKDHDTPLSHGRLLHDVITNSKLVVFPDSTHSLPLVKPEECAMEMKKFI